MRTVRKKQAVLTVAVGTVCLGIAWALKLGMEILDLC